MKPNTQDCVRSSDGLSVSLASPPDERRRGVTPSYRFDAAGIRALPGRWSRQRLVIAHSAARQPDVGSPAYVKDRRRSRGLRIPNCALSLISPPQATHPQRQCNILLRKSWRKSQWDRKVTLIPDFCKGQGDHNARRPAARVIPAREGEVATTIRIDRVRKLANMTFCSFCSYGKSSWPTGRKWRLWRCLQVR